MESFSKNLKARAKTLEMSNAEVAEMAHLDPRRYGHYVTGRSEPDLATLCRIARVLKTSPNALLGFDDGKTSKTLMKLNEACQYLDETQIEMLLNFAEATLRKK